MGLEKKKKKIELATRTSNALIFAHNARNTGGIGNQSRRSMSKSPVPLNAALHPLIPASLPARSSRSVVCSPHTALPHTSSGPLLTNSQPLLPHFPRGPLPSLPFPPSHITAHSIPDSAVSRRNPARRLPSRPPARPAVPRASPQPGPRPRRPSLAPTPLPRGAPALRPPAPSLRTALRRSAAPPQPESRCRARTRRTPPPRTPGPLPAPPPPPLPSRSPPPPLPPQPVCKEGSPGRAGPPARREAPGAAGCVGRPAGRRRGAGGSALGHPGQHSPEPPRLRLTIGSGCSALPLIGAGASWPGPGAAWEMESPPGPRPVACRESEAASAAKP